MAIGYIPDTQPTPEQVATEFQLRDIGLERYYFRSSLPGPHLTVTARIHGDEGSGEVATRIILNDLLNRDHSLRLKRGSVTLYPALNQPAAFVNHRSYEHDGNRNVWFHRFWDYGNIQTSDRLIGDVIARDFREQKWRSRNSYAPGWYHLDLHSVPLDGAPHSITADRPQDLAFAKAIGLPTIYTNWREAQRAVNDGDLRAIDRTRKEHDRYTLAAIYASAALHSRGSVCVESGQNDDPVAVDVAYEAIRNALFALGLAEPVNPVHTVSDGFNQISFEQALYRREASEVLSADITRDAQPVEPSKLILSGDTREVIVLALPPDAKQWLIAHPIPTARVGEHIAYLALEK